MVRLIFFLCLILLGNLEAEPIVEAAIDSSRSQANFPLEGTITVTHSKQEKIDDQTFELDGKHLETLFVKDVVFSSGSDTLISIYTFRLPAKEKGLYLLPAVSVKIDGKTYKSIPATYEVTGAEGKPSSSPKLGSSKKTTRGTKQAVDHSPVIFQLEAKVKGPATLFPGERTLLFYRISYNRSIDLSHSELPLIHPPQFRKVGDVQIRDSQQGNLTIQDLTQEVEASKLGTFEFGPSIIEGYAYTLDPGGNKVYDQTLLHAEAPVITLEVKPFPQKEQPLSFNGALGKIKAEVHLDSPSTVLVGDTVQFTVIMQGVANLTELRLPSLDCQPGFSGFFQTSDLPPPAEIDKSTSTTTKVFRVELRPLTAFVNEIPSIEVSSFDPTSGKYVIEKTAPIKLTVTSPPSEKIASQKKVLAPQQLPLAKEWPQPVLLPLELDNQPAEITLLTRPWFSGPWVLWLLPLGVSLLILQREWHRRLLLRPKPEIKKSEEFLRKALKAPINSLEAAHWLENALWWRLVEKGILPEGGFNLEKLPDKEPLGKVRTLLYKLQALQYSPDKGGDLQQLQLETKEMFGGI